MAAGAMGRTPAIPHTRRAATARRLGEAQMRLALDAATSADPAFGARAFAFIVDYVHRNADALGGVPGEMATMAAQQAGIGQGRDARAFGGVFKKALRDGAISVVGSCKRVRGHGASGGRLYGRGRGSGR